jgi:hypothetical protein
MADVGEQGERRGLSRRDLIKASAVAGAAAWTAPVIIDSLASPAAAQSGGLPTTCSYALIVFSFGGGTYIMRIAQGSASCSFDNSTSSDDDMTRGGTGCATVTGPDFPCGGHAYTGGNCHNTTIWQDGSPVSTAVPSGTSCDSLFTIQNCVVTVKNSSTTQILFAVSHHGPASGWNGSKFYPICPPSSSTVTLNCGSGC